MKLISLSLQHFRNYTKAQFSFDPQLTVIVGANASGKSNLVEALGILSTGKSFRTSKEKQLIQFEQSVARVTGGIEHDGDTDQVDVVVALNQGGFLQKRYLINGVSKRRASLTGIIPVVFFTPLDLDIVSGQPGNKRRFLDEVLEQTDREYSDALAVYGKALRQRNALLQLVQQTGTRDRERFVYWDTLLIKNGQTIMKKREDLIQYVNDFAKELFDFTLVYDKSVMSEERLLQYKDAEVGAGMTLVGPQRDDVIIQSLHPLSKKLEDVKYFCSRGQQRLVTLELKHAQISYLHEHLGMRPLLVLDDIFSELDQSHIESVLQMTHNHQTIITTTHEEFLGSHGVIGGGTVIKLGEAYGTI
jgi:DNA replication and repair protein RecF